MAMQTVSRGADRSSLRSLPSRVRQGLSPREWASIGGMATVIGTPTNAIFVSYAKQNFPDSPVSFGKWLAFGLPFAAMLLLFCWRMLLWIFPIKKDEKGHSQTIIQQELAGLGKMAVSEKRVMIIFLLVILGWVSGSLLWYGWFPKSLGVGDTEEGSYTITSRWGRPLHVEVHDEAR